MKVLIVLVLALATAAAEKIKTRNVLVPAGRPEGRISNGYTASEGQIPYQVGLALQAVNGEWNWCGGTLLNHTKILTAAHCVEDTAQGKAYMGSINPKDSEAKHKFNTQNIIIHPGWDTETLENDIAIINIPHTEYSEKIQPVKLPSPRASYSSLSGELGIASGWGRTEGMNPKRASSLQYGYVYISPIEKCKYASESQVCATTDNMNSICQGDSGGPLVLRSTKVLVGISSYSSFEECKAGVSAVFTRVDKYSDWIKENAGA